MKIEEMHVEVGVDLCISRGTVEKCLKIVQWWLNENPDMMIEGGIRDSDGKMEDFVIKKRKEYRLAKEGHPDA